jgi:lysophospholipase L1-like esterase
MMKQLLGTRPCLALALLAGLTGPAAFAQNGNEHWVVTWTGAPLQAQPVRLGPVGQTTTAAQQAQAGFANQTVRMMVPISIGGRRVRVHVSNAYGTTPLAIGAAHIGVHAKGSAIAAGSDRALTFSGKPAFTIPPGAAAISDPVDLDAPPLAELAISVFVPGPTGPPTIHPGAQHTSYVSKAGDATAQTSFEDAASTQSWYWVTAVDVLAPASAGAIIAFGDSITDGARSSMDSNSSWPSRLAARLQASPATSNMAVGNQGIGGNRILRDVAGANALARFDTDVLSQSGVRWLVVLEGINDIGRGAGPTAIPSDAVTSDELIAGLRQMVERAHTHGIRIAGATLTPYTGAPYYSDKGEVIRAAVNTWIRTSGAFDAVIDFEAAMRDPGNPKTFLPAYDSGDHLHPSDAGYKAMADAIDLKIFEAGTMSAAKR